VCVVNDNINAVIMKMLNFRYKLIIFAGLILFVFVAAFLLKGNGQKEKYVLEKIKYGNIETTVTCTGIINAKGTVEVGSRISGTINKLYADYNQQVCVNQVLGVLDTLILSKEYAEVKGLVERKKNKLNLSRQEYNASTSLYEKKLISNREYLTYKTNYLIDSFDYKAEVSRLEKSKATIGYAYIRSPINGIVIDRSVEEGQTIAANFTTPVLYVIAKDLSKMEILVSVDESDIGAIKTGQNARFTVNAYPDSIFYGQVRELRMKPKTVQNVVTYTVVLDTENEKKLLLPGMTATVDFIIEGKNNIFMVPLSAIRFEPTEKMLKIYNEQMGGMAKKNNLTIKKKNNESSNEMQVWCLNKDNKLIVEKIIVGISDLKNIEVIKSWQLRPGMDVITGIVEDERNNKKPGNNKTIQIMGPSNSAPGGGGPPSGM